MSEETCTVNDAFGGIALGDCGQATETVAVYECDRRHVVATPMCRGHADTFLPDEDYEPPPMLCVNCMERDDRRSESQITGIREPILGPIPGQAPLFPEGVR